jgi:1,4-alpha-glucan branching enzyme
MTTGLHPDAIAALSNGSHGQPFDVLGMHQVNNGTIAIRAFRPAAKALYLIDETNKKAGKKQMERLNDMGFFEIEVEAKADTFQYHLSEVTYEDAEVEFQDPYRFPLTLTDHDLYLHAEGRLWEVYDKFGAHQQEVDGTTGVRFIVWAPNAQRVSVVGNFNRWDGRVHPMQPHGNTGVWELFIPGLDVGEYYKYEIKSHHHNYHSEKVDPYGFHAERRPQTASIVADLDSYEWGDKKWMEDRAQRDPLTAPLAIYEMHFGSWKRKENGEWLTYREMADELIPYIKDMGFTHIELMPIAEHPFDASWGYQVTGYYAPSSRYGTPQDLMYFIDQCHQNGIGIILDWVPAHFPKDGHALSYFDGTHLYSHEDARLGEHPDWGTYIFNYGRNEVRNFLIANALFWLKKYHIDGLRVDAVSSMVYLDFSREQGQWIPNQYGGNENLEAVQFLQEANYVVHGQFPGVMMIAEESTAWPMVTRPTYLGGLGFTFKWNMGWMHDTLEYMSKNPIYRKWEHNKLTFSMVYAYNENFVLALSHDEVVHGKGSLMSKMPGDWWQSFAQVRLLLGYQYTHPGKKLNFMGTEIGQWSEWSEARDLDWNLLELPTHQQLNRFVKDLNHLYRSQPALYEQDLSPEGFRWIDANDADNSVLAYMRFAKKAGDFLVVVCNLTPIVREDYLVGVPMGGYYREILNGDSAIYGGSNVGNYGGVHTEQTMAHGYGQSLRLVLPPLSTVIFKIQGPE